VLYVPQTVSLFDRPLADNARYPPCTADLADIEALLQDWAFDDIDRPIDLTRPAGQRGERLSGGQVQKLELARLAHVQVPLLILDETTSALDPASERAIIAHFVHLVARRTTIILITHRQSILDAADQVIDLG